MFASGNLPPHRYRKLFNFSQRLFPNRDHIFPSQAFYWTEKQSFFHVAGRIYKILYKFLSGNFHRLANAIWKEQKNLSLKPECLGYFADPIEVISKHIQEILPLTEIFIFLAQ